MPLRLGWSILGLTFISIVIFSMTSLFLYYIIKVDINYKWEALGDAGKFHLAISIEYFLQRFFNEFIWFLMESLIFVSVLVVVMGNRPILTVTKRLFSKYFREIFLIAFLLTSINVRLVDSTNILQYSSLTHHLINYTYYAVGSFFVFSLIEVVQKDRGIYEALANSILLLKGRYLFTFIVLMILLVSLNKLYVFPNGLYQWVYEEKSRDIFYYDGPQGVTFIKEMTILRSIIVSIMRVFILTIYFGAVVYLYNLYTAQDEAKAA